MIVSLIEIRVVQSFVQINHISNDLVEKTAVTCKNGVSSAVQVRNVENLTYTPLKNFPTFPNRSPFNVSQFNLQSASSTRLNITYQ